MPEHALSGKPEILLVDRPMTSIIPMIEADYQPVEYWQYESPQALAAAHPDLRVIATHGGLEIPHALVEALPRLGLIISVGAGYEGTDVAHARARGIEVANGAGTNAADVAETAIALLLQLVIPIRSSEADVREGRWAKEAPSKLRRSLREMKVGIVGMGHLGKALAKRLEVFDCEIEWYGPRPKDVSWSRARTLEALAESSDAMVLCAELNENTRHMIDARILELLGPQGFLVNVSRGGVVDEDALIAALKSGTIAAAALDVFEEEPTPPQRWADVPNTILTPHMSGHASAAFTDIGKLLRENLRLFFAGEAVLTPV